jgi:hypothetical protein
MMSVGARTWGAAGPRPARTSGAMAECAMLDFTRRLIAFRQEDGNQRIAAA